MLNRVMLRSALVAGTLAIGVVGCGHEVNEVAGPDDGWVIFVDQSANLEGGGGEGPVYVTDDPDSSRCSGEFREVPEGMFDDGYNYEGYYYCDGVLSLDGVDTEVVSPDVIYVWFPPRQANPPQEDCCSSGTGSSGVPGDEDGDGLIDNPDPDEILTSLDCTSAAFLGSTTCTLDTNSNLSVVGWSFESSSGQHQVTMAGGTTVWSGPVVISGEVFVEFMSGGKSYVEETSLFVAPRQNFTMTEGDFGPATYSPALEVNVGNAGAFTASYGGEAGKWCRSGPDCAADVSYYRPDFAAGETGGYSMAQVPGTGPNGGLWYVSSANITSKAIWAFHPQIRPNAPPQSPSQWQCGDMNWYAGNVCRDQQAEADAFLQGVEDHETNGRLGSTGGHETIARGAAIAHDPVAAIADLVGQTQAILQDFVESTVDDTALNADIAIADAPEPSGNYAVQIFRVGAFGWTLSPLLTGEE